MLVCLITAALAAPADLDGLVVAALDRDPAAVAADLDAAAAHTRADAARRPMSPQLMVGVDALGAPKDSFDPPMLMLGVSQMLRGPAEGARARDRLALDATRIDVEEEVRVADLRVTLWQLVADIDAEQDEIALLDEQIEAAVALEQIGLARYGAGASVGSMPAAMGSMGSMGSSDAAPMAMPAATPSATTSAGGMAGRPGMGGASAPARSVAVPRSADMGMSSASSAPTGTAGGLAALLRLDTDLERLRADRLALGFALDGDLLVLRALVGEETGAAVAAEPERFVGGVTATDVPERRLAGVDRDAASASEQLARARRAPDVMLTVSERFMPDDMGMPAGTDIGVGVELPVFGAARLEVDAATADRQAADARAERLERDLAIARASARADWAAARARRDSLAGNAVPRATQSWETARALYAADRGTADDVVRAWEDWIAVARESVQQRRDTEYKAAAYARLGGEP